MWSKERGGRGRGREAVHLSMLVLLLPSLPGHLDLRIDGIGKKKKTKKQANNKIPHQHPKIKSLKKNEPKKDIYTWNELL